MAYTGSRESDRSKIHKDTPACHLCYLMLKALKPRDSRYPIEIRTLGDQLRARRLDLGLYQKDLAALFEVTEDTICYWENNRVRPSSGMTAKIIHFLDRSGSQNR
jgi:DNA-binding transcriptional regulator YiaG